MLSESIPTRAAPAATKCSAASRARNGWPEPYRSVRQWASHPVCTSTALPPTLWPRNSAASSARASRRRRLSGREHTRHRLEQLPLRARPIGRFSEHYSEPAPQQRIAHRVGSELEREWCEPRRLARPCTGPRHGSVLLEQREHEGALGWELAVERPLREPRCLSHFIQRAQLDASLGEDPQTRVDQQRLRLRLAPRANDTHKNLRYLLASSLQRDARHFPTSGTHQYLNDGQLPISRP